MLRTAVVPDLPEPRFWPIEIDSSVATSAFMGTNPENEVQPKVNECIALNGPSGRPFIESAHNLHELASHQNDRAPQYEGDAIE